MGITFSRRAALLGVGALPLAQIARSQARPKFIAIGSANINNGGVNACSKAVEVMRAGGDTLDAVIAGVNILELDASCDHMFLVGEGVPRFAKAEGFEEANLLTEESRI